MYDSINTEILEVHPFGPTPHISFSAFFSPELSEAQQKLLVKSMEKNILPVQLKLVSKNGRCGGEFEGKDTINPNDRQNSLAGPLPHPKSSCPLLISLHVASSRGRRVHFGGRG